MHLDSGRSRSWDLKPVVLICSRTSNLCFKTLLFSDFRI